MGYPEGIQRLKINSPCGRPTARWPFGHYAVVTLSSVPRTMKKTLYSRNISLVQQHVHSGVILQAQYNKILSALSVAAVASGVCEASPTASLAYSCPVLMLEKTVPRPHRCALTQLHSAYCICLRSYLFSIGEAQIIIVLNAKRKVPVPFPPSSYLFEYPAFPTDLTVKDLWSCPRERSIFIYSLPPLTTSRQELSVSDTKD
jgi:hypothetical protein